MFSPDVDLIVDFRVSKSLSATKQQTREEARKAENQYSRLIETLTYAGLKAVGRRGESLGHILVFVSCPQGLLDNLIQRERRSDFLSGLPVTPIADGGSVPPLSPADRIRIIHSYISSTPTDGGLGISPGSVEWDLVQSVFPLHNRQFNGAWVKTWKPRNITSMKLSSIQEQFGDAVAYYFGFLSSYTTFLAFPAVLGVFAHYFLLPFSPVYSVLIALWATFFVEWWRVREQILALRFGTRNSFRVEKRRAQYKPGLPWWQRELRMFLTIPIIAAFGAALVAILTAIFVFEAFITHLYQGPGHQLIGFSPTIIFVVLVPQFLALYNAIAVRLTNWENHAHQSTYAASMTLKTFALGALVSYSGISLSAFVYVPFGEGVMNTVQTLLFKPSSATETGIRALIKTVLNGTATTPVTEKTAASDNIHATEASGLHGSLWDTDVMNARQKLNPGRLRDQMFAITVTNQIVNSFTEVGLPFVLRRLNAFLKKDKGKTTEPSQKKKVVFEDEKERGGLEEREYLERVRSEAALPEYNLFTDYNEMVVQFGYVALWSTIWPLAGAMAFINNVFELRGDAFKISVHHRRPLPVRTDTIGPWLDALTFLTWLSAMTNTALVYLFSPSLAPVSFNTLVNDTTAEKPIDTNDTVLIAEEHLVAAAGGAGSPKAWGVDGTASLDNYEATKELLLKAALVALIASHAWILARMFIRHVVQKIWWKGSNEVLEREREETELKEKFLSGVGVSMGDVAKVAPEHKHERGVRFASSPHPDPEGFWDHDEGVEEIQRIVKEA